VVEIQVVDPSHDSALRLMIAGSPDAGE